MTIPDEFTPTPITDGDDDEGAAPAGDAAPSSDGVDGQDVEQAAPESSPPEATVIGNPEGERDMLVEVRTDEDGNGSAFCGLSPDLVAGARAINAAGDVTFGEAHTIAITRVEIIGSDVRDGTVLVAVTPK